MTTIASSGPAGPTSRSEGASPQLRNLLAQVGLVAVAVLVYFGVRHLTEGGLSAATRNAHRVLEVESWLGLRHEAWFQAQVIGDPTLARLANWVYIFGHWPVIVGVLGWLAWRRPDRFLIYRNALLLSGLVGMVIFASFPVCPPRLLDIGLVDTVTEQSSAYRVFQPPSLVNQYAAMPSFHAGWDLLMGIALVVESRRLWVRVLGALLPVAMFLSVVVTANHYLLDPIVGAAIVLAALWAAHRLHARRLRDSRDHLERPVGTTLGVDHDVVDQPIAARLVEPQLHEAALRR